MDYWQSLWPLGTHYTLDQANVSSNDLLVEKQDCVQCLILGGGRDSPMDSQMCEEGSDLWFAHVVRMSLAVEENEAAGPL
jgi:hypothetical protein